MCIEKIGNYATLSSNGRYLFTSLSYLREKGLRGRTEEEEEEEKEEERSRSREWGREKGLEGWRRRRAREREGRCIYTAGIDRSVSPSKLETEGRTLGGMVAHLVMDSEDRRVG